MNEENKMAWLKTLTLQVITLGVWGSISHCAKLRHVRLFATPWTVARQVPPSREFSRQEYWRGLPFPTPGDLPNPGIAPMSPASPALKGRLFTTKPRGYPGFGHY